MTDVRIYLDRDVHIMMRNFSFRNGIDIKTAYRAVVSFVLNEDGYPKDEIRGEFLRKNQQLFRVKGRIL